LVFVGDGGRETIRSIVKCQKDPGKPEESNYLYQQTTSGPACRAASFRKAKHFSEKEDLKLQ
jgi:hypothetical protein